MNYMLRKTFHNSYKKKFCATELTILSVSLKKELASIHLFELHFLNFVEPPSPHALNRNSADADEPPTDSLLSESTSPLR